MTSRSFVALAVTILLGATMMRTAWLRADPPTSTVGIVWHDEGPWVHNARNRALWGVWRTDDWNPVFVTPVFTALEYAAFRAVGVGTWQARVVPVASGLVAIAALMWGLTGVGTRKAAILGGALLAADYVFVMWNRAALLESTMTAFMVVAWAAYARAGRRPAWGIVAGVSAIIAFFTKASAAFFVASIGADAIITLLRARRHPGAEDAPSAAEIAGARRTLAGLVVAAVAIGAIFVLPHWSEYHFYNVTMSVERKPSYTIGAILMRASGLPVAQDIFSQMWFVLVAALLGAGAILVRWRRAEPADRLLVLWLLVGFVELTIHDTNARRYVMFIPAFAALAARFFTASAAWMPTGLVAWPSAKRWIAVPFLLAFAYLVAGAAVRLGVLDRVHAGHLKLVVRFSAGLALALAAVVVIRWESIARWAANWRPSSRLMVTVVVLSIGWDAVQYALWADARTDLAYQASVEIGRLLPPGTLVQGKLANGLSLDNRIRPLFIGNGFGNYADRLDRNDVRYILTYVLPTVGFESQVHSGLIPDLLAHYPQRRVVATFDVTEPPDELGGGVVTPDRARAALIEKGPPLRTAAREPSERPGPSTRVSPVNAHD